MNIFNLIITAFRALMKNGLRTFLTMLGIIIGVAAVIVMESIGKGSEEDITARINSLGSNMIIVAPNPKTVNGVKMGQGGLTLEYKDVTMIKRYSSATKYCSPLVALTQQVKYHANNWSTRTVGVLPEYFPLRGIWAAEGTIFSDEDLRNISKVCIIGKTVKENLFPGGEDPIGKTIIDGTIPLKIIGIQNERGQSATGTDQDDIIIAPYTCVQDRMVQSLYVNVIFVSAKTGDDIPKAVSEIKYCVRTSHHLATTDQDDFLVRTLSDLMATVQGVTKVLTLLLASVASISLLVGGIGIMNIMFVSVTERTREIGTRLAIGATSFDVMWQLLIEALVISLVAGVIGILTGLLVTKLITYFAGWRTVVTPFSILISFAVCTVIGIFFGWYPARKAASLNPIEALRYE
jgi:putative ABC transport system permease protein